MSTAPRLLRRARQAARLSQTRLANASGIGQSSISLYETGHRDPTAETLTKLLASAGSQLVSVATVRPTVASVADQVAVDIARGRFDHAYRSFLGANDSLRAETALNRLLLAVEEPEPTGDVRFDAALAGLVVHYLSLENLPIPDWVDRPGRFLDEPWYIDDSAYGRERDPGQTPKALLERNVILAEDGLASA